ncbi:hypothetical protein TNCV_877381 [Trichonephila clavipes]|nr:hypothetical protein TNCV_877381 [Trichonephila clavipes]
MKLCLVHMCLNGICGFLGGRDNVEDDEHARRLSCRGSGKNGKSPEGFSKNLATGLLPAMAAPNVEACEC